jgi:hypothetical protein
VPNTENERIDNEYQLLIPIPVSGVMLGSLSLMHGRVKCQIPKKKEEKWGFQITATGLCGLSTVEDCSALLIL